MAGPGLTVAPHIDASSLVGATLKFLVGLVLVGLQGWYYPAVFVMSLN